MIHFINLSRGFLCPHAAHLETPHFTRIQSTHCEQKRWDLVIFGAGPDLLYNLATGERCIVHDCSEKDRETRACWQGLAWLRLACSVRWGRDVAPAVVRNGQDASEYFRAALARMPKTVLNHLDHFSKWSVAKPLLLESCQSTVVRRTTEAESAEEVSPEVQSNSVVPVQGSAG